MLLFKNGICVTDKISGKLECNAKKNKIREWGKSANTIESKFNYFFKKKWFLIKSIEFLLKLSFEKNW